MRAPETFKDLTENRRRRLEFLREKEEDQSIELLLHQLKIAVVKEELDTAPGMTYSTFNITYKNKLSFLFFICYCLVAMFRTMACDVFCVALYRLKPAHL